MTAGNIHEMVAEALRKRALMATALCAVAEGQAQAGHFERATRTISSVRSALADINMLLSGDVSHLPSGTLRDVSDLLGHLNPRISAMEAWLEPTVVH